jgi:hypothetical protein
MVYINDINCDSYQKCQAVAILVDVIQVVDPVLLIRHRTGESMRWTGSIYEWISFENNNYTKHNNLDFITIMKTRNEQQQLQ